MASGNGKEKFRAALETYNQGSRREDLLEAAGVLISAAPGMGSLLAAYFNGTANEYKSKRLEALFEVL